MTALGIAKPNGQARRTTFLVDREGVVRRIWEDVAVDGHAEEVLAAARSLQAAD